MTENPINESVATVEAAALMEVCSTMSEIKTLEDFRRAGEVIVQARARYNALEAKKATITAGARTVLRETALLFDAPMQNYQALEERLKAMACDFVEHRMVSALLDAQGALAAGNQQAMQASFRAIPTLEGVSFKTTVDFEIEDLSLVPRDYFKSELDTKKIRTHLKNGVEIPGLKTVDRVTAAVTNTP